MLGVGLWPSAQREQIGFGRFEKNKQADIVKKLHIQRLEKLDVECG